MIQKELYIEFLIYFLSDQGLRVIYVMLPIVSDA